MQADVKRAEIVLVQKVLRRTLLTNFIQTTAGPPLFWLPGKHNAATQSLLQKEQQKLEAYKVGPLACQLFIFAMYVTQTIGRTNLSMCVLQKLHTWGRYDRAAF